MAQNTSGLHGALYDPQTEIGGMNTFIGYGWNTVYALGSQGYGIESQEHSGRPMWSQAIGHKGFEEHIANITPVGYTEGLCAVTPVTVAPLPNGAVLDYWGFPSMNRTGKTVPVGCRYLGVNGIEAT